MKFRDIGPYRFFFTSNDRDEPPHIHIEREGMAASSGSSHEHHSEIMEAWNEFLRR